MSRRLPMRIGVGAAICAGVVVLVAIGCRRETPTTQRVTAASDWTPPVAVDAPLSQRTAADMTRHLLQLLHAHLQAIAHGRHDLAAQFRDRAARELAAGDDLLPRYRAVAGRFAAPDEEALRRIVEGWAAVIAYYADGLDLDDLRPGPVSADLRRTVVDVPARGPRGRTLIRVGCLRGDDDRWRATGMEFVPPATTTAPAVH